MRHQEIEGFKRPRQSMQRGLDAVIMSCNLRLRAEKLHDTFFMWTEHQNAAIPSSLAVILQYKGKQNSKLN